MCVEPVDGLRQCGRREPALDVKGRDASSWHSLDISAVREAAEVEFAENFGNLPNWTMVHRATVDLFLPVGMSGGYL